jgi:hypothetical protein
MALAVDSLRDLARATLRRLSMMVPDEPHQKLDKGNALLRQEYEAILRRIADMLK